MLERHEALRTVFSQRATGQPVQVITQRTRFALQIRGSEWARRRREREALVALKCRGSAGRRFDLSAGPLIRGRLMRLNDDEHVLLVTMHHIVSDGWSMGILIRELAALYAALSRRAGQSAAAAADPVRGLCAVAAAVAAGRSAGASS